MYWLTLSLILEGIIGSSVIYSTMVFMSTFTILSFCFVPLFWLLSKNLKLNFPLASCMYVLIDPNPSCGNGNWVLFFGIHYKFSYWVSQDFHLMVMRDMNVCLSCIYFFLNNAFTKLVFDWIYRVYDACNVTMTCWVASSSSVVC